MPRKKITVAVISELTTDQRVIRICTTLQQMGFEVTVIARKLKNSLPLDTYIFRAKRIRCYFRKGFLQYAEFNTKLFFRLLFAKTDYLLANDLDTLLPAYIASKWRRKKLFYDTHEYFTGVPELQNHPFKKRVWKRIENWIFPKLKTVYTVNDAVKEKYQQEYGNIIAVIRNVPVTGTIVPKTVPGHWQGKYILLMQGAGINAGRGGMELLEAMCLLPGEYHLVYIGSGNAWDAIARQRKEWQLESRVDMIDKLPPAELKTYTPLAALGFTLDEFESENCLFNLPNKVFDYIHAGVPVVATAIPEVKRIIEQFDCGICLSSQEPASIAGQILSLMNDKEKYKQLKANTKYAAGELCWEKESQKLTAIYQPYL